MIAWRYQGQAYTWESGMSVNNLREKNSFIQLLLWDQYQVRL